jgi:hypothetical protein
MSDKKRELYEEDLMEKASEKGEKWVSKQIKGMKKNMKMNDDDWLDELTRYTPS